MTPSKIQVGQTYNTKTFGPVRVLGRDKDKKYFKCFSEQHGARILHASVFVEERRVAA